MDSVLFFVSSQGSNSGAHDGDQVGKVILPGTEIDADDIAVDAGVFLASKSRIPNWANTTPLTTWDGQSCSLGQ